MGTPDYETLDVDEITLGDDLPVQQDGDWDDDEEWDAA
jgi:hypothetical protein